MTAPESIRARRTESWRSAVGVSTMVLLCLATAIAGTIYASAHEPAGRPVVEVAQ